MCEQLYLNIMNGSVGFQASCEALEKRGLEQKMFPYSLQPNLLAIKGLNILHELSQAD